MQEIDREEVKELLDELQETIDKAAELAQLLPEKINSYEYGRLVSELTGSEGPYISTGVPDYVKGYREALDEADEEEEA